MRKQNMLRTKLKRTTAMFLAALMVTSLCGVSTPSESGTAAAAEKNKRVFVELKATSAYEQTKSSYTKKTATAEENVLDAQDSVISKVESITGEKVVWQLGYLTNGFSIDATPSEIVKIRRLAKVASVTETGTIARENTETKSKSSVSSETASSYQEDNWSDASEYDGTGTVVAVIDSGMDYKHKDLKLTDASKAKISETKGKEMIASLGYGTYCSAKVPFAYDYAICSSDEDDLKTRSELGAQHGMHVAGIIGANGGQTSLSDFTAKTGSAKETQILNMNIFGYSAATSADSEMKAVEDAVKLGADIINMSLGNGFAVNNMEGFTEMIDNAKEMGVQVVSSIGNAGHANMTRGDADSIVNTDSVGNTRYSSSCDSPATFLNSTGVAACESTYTENLVQSIATEDKAFSYEKRGLLDLEGKYEIVDCGLGTTEDMKKVDVKDKVALIQRGSIDFASKNANAIAAGAKAVILYNNQEENLFTPYGMTLPYCFISLNDGMELKDNIGEGIFFQFEKVNGPTQENSNKGKLTYYSSWGPTDSLMLKPDVAGVGGVVYSLQEDNQYTIMSGTSMAAPYVSGISATILQSIRERGLTIPTKDIASFIKNTEMNTAKLLSDSVSDSDASPRQQGAGFIYKADAVRNEVTATVEGVASASLGEVGKTKEFTITFTNYGKTDYVFDCNKSTAMTTYENEDGVIYEDAALAETTCDVTSITVPAGKTATLKATLTIQDNFEKNQYVEGFLHFTSKNDTQPSLSLPYMGYYGDYFDKESNPALSFSYDAAQDTDSDGDGLTDHYFDEHKTFYDSNTEDGEDVFSPNGDDYNENLYPTANILRLIGSVQCNIVDQNKKTVIEGDANCPMISYKHTFMDQLSNSVTGKKYNTSTDQYETIPDGYYYYEVIAKQYQSSKTQTYYLPLIVDTAAPIASNGVLEQRDEKWYATFTAKDVNGSGFYQDTNVQVSVNGKKVLLPATPSSWADNNRAVKYEVCLSDAYDNLEDIRSVGIVFYDRGNNEGSITCIAKDQNGVTLDDDLGMTKDGKYQMVRGAQKEDESVTISGYADSDISAITYKQDISGKTYEADITKNNQFTVTVMEEDTPSTGTLTYEYAGKKQEKRIQVLNTSSAVELLNSDGKNMDGNYFYDSYVGVTNEDEFSLSLGSLTAGDKYCLYDTTTSNDMLEYETCEQDGEAILSNISLSSSNVNSFVLYVLHDEETTTFKFQVIREAKEGEKLNIITSIDLAAYFTVDELSENNEVPVPVAVNKLGAKVTVRALHDNKEIARKECTFDANTAKVMNRYSSFISIPVAQGSTIIQITVEADGQTAKQNVCYIGSLKKPTIAYEDMPTAQDGVYYTQEKEFKVKGTATTYSISGAISVNGKILKDERKIDEAIDMVTVNKNLPFEETVSLKEGMNYIRVKVVDLAGNEVEEKLKVVCGVAPTEKPVVTPAPTASAGTATPKPTASTQPTASPVTATPVAVKKPAKVQNLKIAKKQIKKNKVKLTWKKVSGASGYQIVYGMKKSLKKAVKKVSVKTVSKWIVKLKNKKYYFKVRAYKKSGSKKIYGAYSKVRGCVMK